MNDRLRGMVHDVEISLRKSVLELIEILCKLIAGEDQEISTIYIDCATTPFLDH